MHPGLHTEIDIRTFKCMRPIITMLNVNVNISNKMFEFVACAQEYCQH